MRSATLIHRIAPAVLGIAVMLVVGCQVQDLAPSVSLPPPRVMVLETAPLLIDRLYPSMTGPADRVSVDTSDLDWVVGFRADVVDQISGEEIGDEFFCHSQLQLWNSTRLMVTATGTAGIRFPDGFGMPVSQIIKTLPPSERSLSLFGMVLNNHEPGMRQLTRVRGTIQYFRDDDLKSAAPLKRLYKTGLTMEVEDLAEYAPQEGSEINSDVSTHCVLVGPGNAHWIVPPGPQKTRLQYSDVLPVDVTVHYAVVHLHNHSVYFRLTDATTGDVLWQTDVEYEPDRVQIAKIPKYSSSEGFPMYADHVYEIEAFYDNTTDHDVDAMAQVDLYYHPASDELITYPSGPR